MIGILTSVNKKHTYFTQFYTKYSLLYMGLVSIDFESTQKEIDMKTATKLLATLALSSSLIIGGAMAMGSGERHFAGHGFKMERMAKKLELTEAQTTKIQALVDAHKEQRPEFDKDAMKAKRKQMKADYIALMNASEFDEAAVRAKMAERAEKNADRKISKMKLKHSIYQVLNEEQREQYLAIMDKKKHKMKKRMKKRMKHGYDHDGE